MSIHKFKIVFVFSNAAKIKKSILCKCLKQLNTVIHTVIRRGLQLRSWIVNAFQIKWRHFNTTIIKAETSIFNLHITNGKCIDDMPMTKHNLKIHQPMLLCISSMHTVYSQPQYDFRTTLNSSKPLFGFVGKFQLRAGSSQL